MSTVTEIAADVGSAEPQNMQKNLTAHNSNHAATATIASISDSQPQHSEVEDASKFLGRQAVQFQQFACFRWLVHFSVLDYVPRKGSITYASLASLCAVPESQLKSVTRMAMTAGLFQEPAAGQVAHSPLSEQFATQENLLAWAVYMTSTSAPTAGKMAEQTASFGATTVKNETAFNLAFDTDLPFFDWTAKSPERSKQFAGYMKNVTNSPAVHTRHLLAGFDWEALGEATVVDVGGSTGHASIALAEAFPQLSFVVQDLESTLATKAPDSLPQHLSSRITFEPHDFFTPQPHNTADVYLLRMILHDWPADAARNILIQLSAAMKDGARIIVMDTLLPQPGTVDKEKEATLRVRDLTMMQAFNAKEREWEDWAELVDSVDPPLEIRACKTPEGSAMAVLEIVRKSGVA